MHFIGIDLAWSPKNNSAAAVIEAEQRQGKLIDYKKQLESDYNIIDFIANFCNNNPAIIGIDAPLIVPNYKGQRPCEKEINTKFGRHKAGAYPANRDRLARDGKVRGEELVKKLKSLRFINDPCITRQDKKVRRVVEVYPHPATITLFKLSETLKYKYRKGRDLGQRQRELRKLQDLVESLSSAEPALQTNVKYFQHTSRLLGSAFKAHEDFLDAILCAYIVYHAWYWGEQGDHGYKIFGAPKTKEGYILVPNHKFWLNSRG